MPKGSDNGFVESVEILTAGFPTRRAGKEVKGTWTSVQGKSGKVTGTLAGSNIARLRLEQLEPCAGIYAGSAVIVEDGQRLHGSYTGMTAKDRLMPRSLWLGTNVCTHLSTSRLFKSHPNVVFSSD